MFCEKCGKPNDDDAVFCEFCGAGFNDPTAGGQAAPAQTPVQAPAPAPVYAAAPAPKKRRKAGVIAAIISAAAVIAVAVFAVFFWNKKPAKTDSYGGGVVAGNSGTSAPAQTGNPTMTVNGKSVPVDLAMLGGVDQGSYVVIASKTDDEVFQVLFGFSNDRPPQSNTTINSSDSYIELGFAYAGKDLRSRPDEINGTFYYSLHYMDADEYSIEIKEYVPNEYIEFKVSGKVEIERKTYDFEAGGKLDFKANYDYEYAVGGWYENNRIPVSLTSQYPAMTTDSYGSGVVTDNSVTSAPAQTGKPTMTVNGKNVNVDLTEFVFTDRVVRGASYGAAFAGKTDDEIFMLEMWLPEEELKSNTTINGSDNNNFYVQIIVTGKAWGIDEDLGIYNCGDGKITEYTLEIGQFVPDEYIEITFSAKTEINGRIYNIKADGKLNFDGYNYLSKAASWIEENVYPTPD